MPDIRLLTLASTQVFKQSEWSFLQNLAEKKKKKKGNSNVSKSEGEKKLILSLYKKLIWKIEKGGTIHKKDQLKNNTASSLHDFQ